jgi:pimeloyl-ACP methyl ester carboxylesterase
MAAFAEGHRAIAYSRRYSWPNTDIPDGVDDQMSPHVDDLATLIMNLNAAPAHLVGNSWGGFICLLTALRHPELVRSLAVEEPPVVPLFVSNRPKPQDVLKLFLTRPRSGAALMKFFGAVVGPATKAFSHDDLEGGVRTFTRGILGAAVYESLPPEIKDAFQASGRTLRASLTGAGFPTFTEDDARSITTPTLLISGKRSPALMRCLTDRLQQLVPNAERVDISGASHLMHHEKPSPVNAAVLDFIARHPGPAPKGGLP